MKKNLSEARLAYEMKMAKKNGMSLRKWMNAKNKKGLVHGCQTVPIHQLPKSVQKCLINMNANSVIKVPIRQKGLTSSGRMYNCHSNVETLVEKFGGQRLVGYLIERAPPPYETVLLFAHSVWITPEGKAVDVTQKEEMQYERFINSDRSFQYFIPVSTSDTALVEIKCYFAESGESAFRSFYFDDEDNNSKHRVGAIKNLPKIKEMVGKRNFEDVYGKNWNEHSLRAHSFTEASMWTGKMLHEIEKMAA